MKFVLLELRRYLYFVGVLALLMMFVRVFDFSTSGLVLVIAFVFYFVEFIWDLVTE